MTAGRPPLVDVAPRGKASQSSTSRWSRPGDAMGALGRHRRAFGFHTDLQQGPWWILELEQPCAPHSVIVHNRHGAARGRAAGLVVEVSADGAEWTVLHRDAGDFGASDDPEGPPPLALHLAGRHQMRLLRLSLPGRDYLHLSRVQVLVEATAAPGGAVPRAPRALRRRTLSTRLRAIVDGSPAPKVFLAARRDGFGERLRAMMNALVLAEHFDGEFRFSWGEVRKIDGPLHTILPKQETFAPDFVAAHAIERPGRGFANITGMEAIKEGARFRVEQVPLAGLLPEIAAGLPVEAAATAFRRIRFAPRLEQARSAAAEFELPPYAAAIHLRAGDIIEGSNRFFGRFAEKAVPWPLAALLAAELRAGGWMPLVFGQDAALSRAVAAAQGGVFVGDLVNARGFDPHQAVLFEITLMARCTEIYAGFSGFALAAAEIAGIALSRLEDRLGRDAIRVALLEALEAPGAGAGVSALQNAFAFWSAAHVHASLFTLDERRRFLDAAARHDPQNALYRLAQVGVLLEADETEAAEGALATLIGAEAARPDGTLRHALRKRRRDRWSGANIVAGFGPLARRDHPEALLCLALTASDPAEVREFADRFLALRPPGLAVYDASIAEALAPAD